MPKQNPRPYRKVVDAITRRIADGELAEGQPLPSINQLAVEYAVSTGTVDRAALILEDRRLIQGVTGRFRLVAIGAQRRARERLAEDGATE